MIRKFLGRVYDARTATWSRPDGSGLIFEEERQEFQLAFEMRNKHGHNGLFVLWALFNLQDKCKKRKAMP